MRTTEVAALGGSPARRLLGWALGAGAASALFSSADPAHMRDALAATPLNPDAVAALDAVPALDLLPKALAIKQRKC